MALLLNYRKQCVHVWCFSEWVQFMSAGIIYSERGQTWVCPLSLFSLADSHSFVTSGVFSVAVRRIPEVVL